MLTINEVVIIILNKHNRVGFWDIIILVYWYLENNISIFQNINSNIIAFMPFYYLLFFPFDDLIWYWVLRLYNCTNNIKKIDYIK